MAKFKITPEDMKRGTVLAPGWYPVVINDVHDEPAGTDGSTNTIVEMSTTGEKFPGVPLKRYFNEKSPSFAIDYIQAVGGTLGEAGGEFNLEAGKGRKCEVYVANEMYKGRMQNRVEGFRPLQASK